MKIVIAHHHLGPGGVTRVIANHILALDAALCERDDTATLEVALLADDQNDGWPEDLEAGLKKVVIHRRTVPGLAYRPGLTGNAEQLAEDVRRSLKNIGFLDETDVLHAHNHSLGKHSVWGAALLLLSREMGLLLQCHDFAEDFRPDNYRVLTNSYGGALSYANYFQAPNVHYATLNGRDHDVFVKAGVAAERLHFLPNPVPPPPEPVDRDAARAKLQEQFGVDPNQPYWLYPVRGIRRKNVGELCLLAAAGQGAVTPGITLCPTNPKEQRFHKRWKTFSNMARHRLTTVFDTGEGEGLSFAENLAAADRIVTTSVAEGFGMVFLESWLAGRLLVGRDLPDITNDFKQAGLDLSTLTNRINIPIDWVGADDYVATLAEAYSKVASAYGRPGIDLAAAKESLDRRAPDGEIDFADLNERLQERVIEKVFSDAHAAEHVFAQWADITDDEVRAERIAANKAVVETGFSLAATGRRLLDLYTNVASQPRNQAEDPLESDKLLDEFLSVDKFRLIRS